MSTFDSDLVRPSKNTHPEDGPSQNLLSEFIIRIYQKNGFFHDFSSLLKIFCLSQHCGDTDVGNRDDLADFLRLARKLSSLPW